MMHTINTTAAAAAAAATMTMLMTSCWLRKEVLSIHYFN